MDTLKLDPFEWAAENLLLTAGLLTWSSNADPRSSSFYRLIWSRLLPWSDLSPEFILLASVVSVWSCSSPSLCFYSLSLLPPEPATSVYSFSLASLSLELSLICSILIIFLCPCLLFGWFLKYKLIGIPVPSTYRTRFLFHYISDCLKLSELLRLI